MWTWKQFQMPGLQAIGEAFETETGIHVDFQVFNPDDAYRTKIQASSLAGDLPDILAYWSGAQFDLAASGLLVDMTNDVDEAWRFR
jgi:multiple sugar transport system substrate-binding protein